MTERKVTIENRLGLHARAAAQLVKTAGHFKSIIRLERCDTSAFADAKSILSVLMLAASRGTQLRLSTNGVDEAEAADTICALFENRFGEAD
jgi:phosphocarrier protein NPr